MPILKGDAAVGVIGTYSQREHAFGESDVRLLQTLANSMGIALENARLFDETQRRSRETAALAEVGRDISATLDLGYRDGPDRAHAKDLLHADNSAIFLPDAGGRTYHAIVAHGDGGRRNQGAPRSKRARASSAACSRRAAPNSSTTPGPIRARSRSRAPIARRTSG